MAQFPSAVKTFTTKNAGDTIQPSHLNDLQDEVSAIEDGLLGSWLSSQIASQITVALPYVASPSTTYTVASSNGATQVLLCAGTFTVDLYAVSSKSGYVVTVKNLSTGTITVDGNAAETIDGATTKTIPVQYAALTLLCDGSAWNII